MVPMAVWLTELTSEHCPTLANFSVENHFALLQLRNLVLILKLFTTRTQTAVIEMASIYNNLSYGEVKNHEP